MPKTFVDLYFDGEVTVDHIGDFVQRWHKTDGIKNMTLHEFIGLTFEEYGLWVADSSALQEILDGLSRNTCPFCGGRRWVRAIGEHPFFTASEDSISTVKQQKINITQVGPNTHQIDMNPTEMANLCRSSSPLTAFDSCLGCNAKISCCRGNVPFYPQDV